MTFAAKCLGVLIIGLSVLTGYASAEILRFGVAGDMGHRNRATKSVYDSMLRADVKRLILPGDNLYNVSRGYRATWDPWREAGFTFDIVALGNHNLSYKTEMKYFGMPGEYFSRSYGDAVRFIVLNSDNSRTGGEQALFLERELVAAKEPLVFVVYHHPTYTVSQFHSWTEKKNFHLATRQVIWKYRSRITALLVGHDHIATMLHFNDLPVILSGATHDVRHDKPRDEMQGDVRVKTAWYFDNKPYWAKLDIDTETGESQVNWIRAADDDVVCSARLITGQKLELSPNCPAVEWRRPGH